MIDRYNTPQSKSTWSDLNKYTQWLKVEAAVSRAQGRAQLAEFLSGLSISPEDELRIKAIEKSTRHDVTAFLTWIEEKANNSIDTNFLHYGLTSSDLVDTSTALQIHQIGAIISKDTNKLIKKLGEMSNQYGRNICVGRTHGMHATYTTFGLKLAGHYAHFKRAKFGLDDALRGINVGKFGGPVGTYAVSDHVVERKSLYELDLYAPPHVTQVIPRDLYAKLFFSLAQISTAIETLALEIRHLQRTEVGEVSEGFEPGQHGSSSMPHKKNPISCENLMGVSRMVRSSVAPSLENTVLWHERDISHSSVERVLLPQATTLVHYSVRRMFSVLNSLVVNTDAMSKRALGNVQLLSPLVQSFLSHTVHTRTRAVNDAKHTMSKSNNYGDVRRVLKSEMGSSVEEFEKMFDDQELMHGVERSLKRALGEDYVAQ